MLQSNFSIDSRSCTDELLFVRVYPVHLLSLSRGCTLSHSLSPIEIISRYPVEAKTAINLMLQGQDRNCSGGEVAVGLGFGWLDRQPWRDGLESEIALVFERLRPR